MTRTDMFLILGLGNPGDDYVHTRHNVGFDVVNALASACVGAGLGFGGLDDSTSPHPSRLSKRQAVVVSRGLDSLPSFRVTRPLHAEILECAIADAPVILAKPTTFMNESGKAALELFRKFSVHRSSFIVCHDDLDLPLGTLRLSTNGSSGGHKGIQSIIDTLGTKDFLRLRLGIGPNTTPDGTRIPAEDFVLKRFAKSERPRMDAAVAKACEVLEVLVREGVDAARKRMM